jgi:hypothetical protein
MSLQKVDSSFDPQLARVPRRPSESPVQSSGAHRTSVNTSPRPGAGAGLSVTLTAPPEQVQPLTKPLAEGTGYNTMRRSLSLWTTQRGRQLSVPPSSPLRWQMALMNAIDTHTEVAKILGQHSPALQPPPPLHPFSCLSSLQPTSNPTFECWPQKLGRN